jgi:hypothetical protein
MYENVFLWEMPGDMTGLAKPVSIKVHSLQAVDDGTAKMVLKSDQLALFVVLTARAQGRFSNNAFLLLPGQLKV